MASVVFLRGVNIGGHRVFRPSALPAQLPELGVVNIGAAGTFVVRRRVGRAEIRRAFRRLLPFAAEIVVCDGAQVRALMAGGVFAGLRLRPGMVRFVSILSGTPKVAPRLPIAFPAGRRWLVKLIARTDCFVAGVYRRDRKTIGCLGRLDRLFDVALTSRNWNTFAAIARVLEAPKGRGRTSMRSTQRARPAVREAEHRCAPARAARTLVRSAPGGIGLARSTVRVQSR